MDMSIFPANPGKELLINTPYGDYLRYPVKTKVVMSGDSLEEILDESAKPYLQSGDFIFMSEKIVAISQGRAYKIEDIHPSRLARFLSRFVYKSPYGIGLGMPETMQLAIEDIGVVKILFAAFCAAVTKPFGIHGVFYKIVGAKGRAVDGPCDYTLPPYNHYAKKAPKDPDKVAARLAEHIGCSVVIIDANDLERVILGKSGRDLDDKMLCALFADNPLGQSSQQTPVAIVRRAESAEAA